MKKLLTIAAIFISTNVLACGNSQLFEFGPYSSGGASLKHGLNVSKDETKIIIDTKFIGDLINNPTGKELQQNRQELFYLIASGNKEALFAGIKVLSHLIQHPEYITECDSKRELWKKEEVAFVVSRTSDFSKEICNLSKNEYDLVAAYYKNHPALWGMIYDPFWVEGNSPSCSLSK